MLRVKVRTSGEKESAEAYDCDRMSSIDLFKKSLREVSTLR